MNTITTEHNIVPSLWFDDIVERAESFHELIFTNFKINEVYNKN
jgi:hypothetical protein